MDCLISNIGFKHGLFDIRNGLLVIRHGLFDFKHETFDFRHGLLDFETYTFMDAVYYFSVNIFEQYN